MEIPQLCAQSYGWLLGMEQKYIGSTDFWKWMEYARTKWRWRLRQLLRHQHIFQIQRLRVLVVNRLHLWGCQLLLAVIVIKHCRGVFNHFVNPRFGSQNMTKRHIGNLIIKRLKEYKEALKSFENLTADQPRFQPWTPNISRGLRCSILPCLQIYSFEGWRFGNWARRLKIWILNLVGLNVKCD